MPEDSLQDRVVLPDLLRGHAELERTERGWLPHRLPASARAPGADAQLLGAEAQPSGVRFVFRTRATTLELDLHRTRMVLRGVPERPAGTVDLLLDGRLEQQEVTTAGDVVDVDPATGAAELTRGSFGTVSFTGLSPAEKLVEVWLPYHERIAIVALRSDAPLAPAPSGGPVWLHYGSSISQGSNTAGPSTTWPATAARLGGAELVNLGFSGSAMLDQSVARAMRDTPADLISVKIGINLVNADLFRLRAFGPAVHGFLDTLRDGHPNTPLLVISPLFCPIHERTPGPAAFDPAALAEGRLAYVATGDPADAATDGNPLGRLTLEVIREQLAALVTARAAADPHITYIDGLDLYGPADAVEQPLPDALHPDAVSHARIGGRFAARAFRTDDPADAS